MQNAAPAYPTLFPGPCPDDEALSAYIDGNVDPAERESITAHLAGCEDCYARFTDAVEFLLDSNPPTSEDLDFDERLVEFPADRGRLIAQWGSVAALLIVGAGTGGVYFLKPPPPLPTESMASSVPPLLDMRQLWLGPTTRGGGDDEQETKLPDETAAQLGVQLVNLQVSLQTDRVRESQDVIARILGLLKPILFTEELQKGYRGITAALENGKSPTEVLSEASQLAQTIRDEEVVDPTSLDLGQWIEASRLAAISGDPAFFQKSDSRSFLRRLLWRDRLGFERDFKLDPPTRTSLERISDVLGKGDLTAADYAEIQRQTEKILEIHYPEG